MKENKKWSNLKQKIIQWSILIAGAALAVTFVVLARISRDTTGLVFWSNAAVIVLMPEAVYTAFLYRATKPVSLIFSVILLLVEVSAVVIKLWQILSV